MSGPAIEQLLTGCDIDNFPVGKDCTSFATDPQGHMICGGALAGSQLKAGCELGDIARALNTLSLA